MDKHSLINAAVSAISKAYAPYSHFQVGAAILCESGEIYTGANIENVSFSGTICAERVALSAAVMAGCRKISALAVAAGDSPTPPCGICRQVLSEFASPNTKIYFCDKNGEQVNEFLFFELFPFAFKEF